jgi:hypothetical protein
MVVDQRDLKASLTKLAALKKVRIFDALLYVTYL